MKTCAAILEKQYARKLAKIPVIKDHYQQVHAKLKEYDLDQSEQDDVQFFQLEILYYGILNKERMEATFLNTYAAMYDYWQDLCYQERKHQMNVDMERLKPTLKGFPYEGEMIYLPMFDLRMNHLYNEEIVLLELKQYGRYRKDFQDVLKHHAYGVLPFMYEFSTCTFVMGNEACCILYHKQLHRMYKVKALKQVETLYLDPKQKDLSFATIQRIGEVFLQEDEGALIETLIDAQVVDAHTVKKLQKIFQKLEKKAAKNLKK